MKYFSGIFIVFLILTSCSQAPIEPADFKGMSEIEYGESATLKWKFENADYVKIHGMNRKFNPEDSLVVTPWESAKYNISAYKDDGGRMDLSWRVFVKNEEEDEGEPKRGPEILKPANLEPAYQYSDFLQGILKQRDDITQDRIKIIRKIYPEYYDDKMTLRALLLDKFGNYITGYEPGAGTYFSTENYCRFANKSDSSMNFMEKVYNNDASGIHLSICMENSAAAQYNKPILDYFTQFAQTLQEDDFLSFSYFNQDHNMAFPLTAAENAIWEMKNLEIPESSGLSSFYESAFKSIVNLAGASKMNETVLVMIAFGPENSSIAYNSNDVAESARELGIPVYIIGIGNAVENFQLKYLSSITGGKFYYLPD